MNVVRRFHAGEIYELSGLSFRVVRGKKGPDDLRLDVMTGIGWRPVEMALGFFLADFFTDNEEVLYPAGTLVNGKRVKGGEKYMRECRFAKTHGFQAAILKLERERRQRSLFGDRWNESA